MDGHREARATGPLTESRLQATSPLPPPLSRGYRSDVVKIRASWSAGNSAMCAASLSVTVPTPELRERTGPVAFPARRSVVAGLDRQAATCLIDNLFAREKGDSGRPVKERHRSEASGGSAEKDGDLR